jgi:hypothetical protein
LTALTISELSRYPGWQQIKTSGEVQLRVGSRDHTVSLCRARRDSDGPALLYFCCPACGRAAKVLALDSDLRPACRDCAGVSTHPNARLPHTLWGRQVALASRQLVRAARRLDTEKDRNARRRLRRRLGKLLQGIEAELDRRHHRTMADVERLLSGVRVISS